MKRTLTLVLLALATMPLALCQTPLAIAKHKKIVASTPNVWVEATVVTDTQIVVLARPPRTVGAKGIMLVAYATANPAESFAGKPSGYAYDSKGFIQLVGHTHWGAKHTASVWTLAIWDGMQGQSGGGTGTTLPLGRYTLTVRSNTKADKTTTLYSSKGNFDAGSISMVQPPLVSPTK